jgi:hypothetical protein
MEASRIANVSAALLIGFDGTRMEGLRSGRARSLAALMAQLFEDTLQVGDPASVGESPPAALSGRRVPCRRDRRDVVTGVAAAIAAARGERVIVVGEGDPWGTAELLLALVAWPEVAVVMPADEAGSSPQRAIYRCDDLRARARAVLESADPPPSVEIFFAGLEVTHVPLARLGLARPPHPLFTGSFTGSFTESATDAVDPRAGSGGVG